MAIRAAVKQLEDRFEGNSGQLSADDEKEARRVMGRIGRLIACGHPEGQRLKARVRVLLMRAPLMERYADTEFQVQMVAETTADLDVAASSLQIDLPVDLPWKVG